MDLRPFSRLRENQRRLPQLNELLFFLALGWFVFAVIHSALAATTVKTHIAQQWPRLAARYRLVYNLLALLLLLPLAWATHAIPGEPLWPHPAAVRWLANGLALAAFAGIWHVSRYYDMREFLGLSPQSRPVFVISPWHRHIRHPWYSLALVIVWTREMTPAMLVAAVMITLYFAIGVRLEEKKLGNLYGEAYRRYREKVPALIPLPGKRLSEEEARALLLAHHLR